MATDRPGPATTTAAPSRLALAATITGRVAVAGLTGAMAAIHYHLWSTGYRHVPTIGDLFLLNVVVGTVLAVGVLLVPSRLLGLTAATTTLFVAGTLGALVVSLHVGLFGFREYPGAPFLDDSYVVETAGVVVAALLTALSVHPRTWKLHRPHREHPSHRATPTRSLERNSHT